jgi:hypothetical protein
MKKKQEIKPADWRLFAVLVATALALGGAIFYIFLTQPGTRATTQHVRPPYFSSVEAAKPFPQTLDPSQVSSPGRFGIKSCRTRGRRFSV